MVRPEHIKVSNIRAYDTEQRRMEQASPTKKIEIIRSLEDEIKSTYEVGDDDFQ